MSSSAGRFEKHMFNNNQFTAAETYDYYEKVFQRLQSRLHAAERTFRRCLQDLKCFQSERLSSEVPEFAPQLEQPKHKSSKSALSRDNASESPSPLPNHRPITPTRAPLPPQAPEPVTNL